MSASFKCRNFPFLLMVRQIENKLSAHVKRGIPENNGIQNENGRPDEGLNESGLIITAAVTISILDKYSIARYTRFFDNHQYHANNDWGFVEFIKISDLTYYTDCYVNDSIVFEVILHFVVILNRK